MRDHYFDLMSFSDERLLNTPQISKLILDYLSLYSDPSFDQARQEESFIPAVDNIMEAVTGSPVFYDFVLNFLVNGFQRFQMETVLVHIAENYVEGGCETGSKELLKNRMPTVWELARRAEEHVKGMVAPGTLFEELGFNYIGPIDGHDLDTLVTTLRNLRNTDGPRFLHVVTKKGKGYLPAEKDPVAYHGVGTFDPSKDHLPKAKPSSPTYTEVFGKWLCDMAEADPRLLGVTPAMREGSGLVEFEQRFPSRYFDVGIAEQHAVTLAAGLACEGF